MEIKHEIVKALQDETHAEMNLCKKALKYFKGDYNLAKTSIERHRWSMPLSGVVYHEPNEEDIEFIDKIRFKEFDDFFWDLRYSRRIEVKLDKDGKLDCDASGWPQSINEIREIEEFNKQRKETAEHWTPNITVADIIMSSVRQFKDDIKFRDQWFVAEFSKKYVEDSKMYVWPYKCKQDDYFVTLRFPMKDYMEWNKIQFDGNKYTFNNKSVLLKKLLEKLNNDEEN